MLAVIQGVWPQRIGVVLGNREKAFFATKDYRHYYHFLKRAFLDQMRTFDPQAMPDPGLCANFGRWRTYAESHLAERDHLIRVANIRKSQIKKLQDANIATLSALADTSIERIPRLDDTTFRKLKKQASLQRDSHGKDKPLYEFIPPDPETPAMGLALLPPSSPADVFFDMEGYPLAGDGLEYLFGVTYVTGSELAYKDFWAHSPAEEKQAFENFTDWVFARYKADPQMHIYHYAAYLEAKRLFNYRFDPEQVTKMKDDSAFYFAHDLSCKGDIECIDQVNGKITLKLSKVAAANAPVRLSIIPDEYVRPGALESSIYDTVKMYHSENILAPHLKQLLYRERPVIQDLKSAELVDPAKDVVAESIRVIGAMRDSTLCMQGPPGCGKTYTAASVILALIADKKKIGITSNSHKAIVNLLLELVKQARATGKTFKALKIKDDDSEALLEHKDVCVIGDNTSFVAGNSPFDIVAGTAWFFARKEVQEEFDYLFIDEAGQVSLANIVSMARATKNIVLIGDQMQLSQPAKGTHPEGSGKSALDYYLEDHATIPADMGIFLPQTRRMHPFVVTNVDYTPSAVELANKSSVRLLHYSDLPDLARKL